MRIDDVHYEIQSTRNTADGAPAVLAPGATLEFAKLRLSLASPRVYVTRLRLLTNATELAVPLPVYHSRLTYTAGPTLWRGPHPGPLAPPAHRKATQHATTSRDWPTWVELNDEAIVTWLDLNWTSLGLT